MKKELREIIESKIEILSEKKTKDGSLTILAPWIMTGRANRNGRLYSQSLIQREVAKFQDRIKSGSIIGSADHPGGAFTTLDTASHIITKLEVDKNGQGWAEMKILPTSKGKNVIEIINAGGQLGISARGAGTVLPNGIVGNDYKLLGIDIVTNPSEPTAVFDRSNIFESLDFEGEDKGEDMKNKFMGLEESYVQEMMKDCYEIYVNDEGFKGTQREWEKEYGKFVLAEILVQENKFQDHATALKYLNEDKDSEKQVSALDKATYLGATEMGFHGTQEEFEELLSGKTSNQKLTEGQISIRTHTYFVEACASGFVGSYDEWKEKFPAIVESAKEKKVVLSEKKVEPKEAFKSKCSWAEVQSSGFRGTIQEYKEQFSNIEIIPVESAQEKVVVEEVLTEKTLKQEAGRIFVALKEENPDSSVTLESVMKMLKIEEEKRIDIRIKRKAVQIVSRDMFNSGADVDEAKMEKMVKIEVERLTEEREEKKRKNWQAYKRLLSD